MYSLNMECLSSPQQFAETLFDYIVVGGGTAGLVVATRLSEDPDVKVGVIEAGPPVFGEPRVDVPGQFGQTVGTEYDWAFKTIPQVGLGGRSLPWPRGKMLGGTGAMNFLVWNRASRQDYDAWAAMGNPGWGWDDLNYYFKKTESLKLPGEAQQQDCKGYATVSDHGHGGPVQTTYQPHWAETHRHWHDTLQNLGIDTNHAHFGGSNVGAWTSLVNVDPRTQTRSYSAAAYLRPALNRPNLKVLTGGRAERILLQRKEDQGQGGRGVGINTEPTAPDLVATGVSFFANGRSLTARCRREVVLSAGSVGSPQLLELSGIGNPRILERAGIEVKVANPNVGENLQEHMMTMTVFELQPDVVTPENYADADFERETRRLYLESKRGLLTATPASMAYVPVSAVLAHPTAASTLERQAHRFAIAHPPSSREYLLNQALKDQFSPTSRLGQVEYILDHGNYSPVYRSGSSGEETTTTTKHATLMQVLQYPYSRGCIHIDPAEAAAGKVVIDPKYYEGEGELDREVMAAAQAFGDRICRTAPMKDLVRRRVYPPEEVDCDWKTWVRDNTITDWHPVGTCSMLPRARGGVVDPALRVYGTSNLRVVDASIFPLHISAHIQATVYAVAEKAADCIKQTWDTPLRARL